MPSWDWVSLVRETANLPGSGTKSNAPDPLEEEQRRHREAVRDPARPRPGEHVLGGGRGDLDLLVVAPVDRSRRDGPVDEDDVAAVVHDGGVRVHAAEEARLAAAVARLLEELADARLHGILARLHDPAGHLERERVRAEAELAHEDEPPVGRSRHDVHPVGRVRDHEIPLGAPLGVAVAHVPQLEDARRHEHLLAPPLPEGRLARNHFFSGSLSFSPTLRWVQLTPALTDSRSERVTPLARAIFAPVSPGLTMYSPGPATAASPLGPLAALAT